MSEWRLRLWLWLFTLASGLCVGQAEPVTLRLLVSLTPQEVATFRPALEKLDEEHPEWRVTLELVPQGGVVERINAQLAAGMLPDVVRVEGLFAQQWIRNSAFLDLSGRIGASGLDLEDFYPGPLEQFRFQEKLWGLPDTAAPDVVFYNKSMFDAAGLPYPDDTWTYEDMREAAKRLTLDSAGRNSSEAGFDPEAIVQWGWNSSLTFFWQRHLVQAFGADWCINEDCTLMDFTSPDVARAASWWASLVQEDHAALYDPYGGSQTGLPGDPFLAGQAAMGYNGFFAVGQLNDLGTIDYDVIQPFLAEDGKRYTPLSTNGYVISAGTEHPEEAWALIQALLEPEFLAETWGKPGHAVPARRSAASSIINAARAPANQEAILAAMAYGEVFKPFTSSAFETYGLTQDLFVKAMRGDLQVPDALDQIERLANEALARDREP